MTGLVQTYVVLVLAGIFLVGAEIYVPGGVLGVIGSLALLAAVVIGFLAFPGAGGIYSAVGIVLLCGLGLVFWIFYFPRTAAGRRLTLERDGRSVKAVGDTYAGLVGREGVAQSPLRPSGIAVFDGHRRDVIAADGLWIEAGAAVRVVEVRGSRIVVRPRSPAAAPPAPASPAGTAGT